MKLACFDKNNNSCIFEYEDEYIGCGQCFANFDTSNVDLGCKECKINASKYFTVMELKDNIYFVSCLGVVGKKNSKFQTKIYSDVYLKSNKIFQRKFEETKSIESISIHNTKHFISDINTALSAIIKEKELLQKTSDERLGLIMNEIELKKKELANSLQDIFRNAKHATLAYGVTEYFSKESELQQCDYSNHKIHGLIVSILYLYEKYFKDKNIRVNIIGDVRDISVFVNYSSIKIGFDQIFNNILKYSNKDSVVSITFERNKDKYIDIVFNMESVCVSEDDQKEIFKIGHRGEKAKEYSLTGDGIGMAVINKVISLNRGEFYFKYGEVCASIEGIPFCKNKFIVRLLLTD